MLSLTRQGKKVNRYEGTLERWEFLLFAVKIALTPSVPWFSQNTGYRTQCPSARLMRSADCTQRGDAAGGGAAAAGPWAALRYSRGLMPCRGTRSREGTGFGIIPVKT